MIWIFLVLYSKYWKDHYIQVYVEKRMIRFKLMMLELEKRDL